MGSILEGWRQVQRGSVARAGHPQSKDLDQALEPWLNMRERGLGRIVPAPATAAGGRVSPPPHPVPSCWGRCHSPPSPMTHRLAKLLPRALTARGQALSLRPHVRKSTPPPGPEWARCLLPALNAGTPTTHPL